MVSTLLVTVGITSVGLASSTSSASTWTVYHGDASGRGVATVLKSVDTSKRAWTSPALNGQIYREPLVRAARVFVATESYMLYAVLSSSAKVRWSPHGCSAVPSSKLPCGDTSPSVGI